MQKLAASILACMLLVGAATTAAAQEPTPDRTADAADGDDQGEWGLLGLLGLAGLLGLRRREVRGTTATGRTSVP